MQGSEPEFLQGYPRILQVFSLKPFTFSTEGFSKYLPWYYKPGCGLLGGRLKRTLEEFEHQTFVNSPCFSVWFNFLR